MLIWFNRISFVLNIDILQSKCVSPFSNPLCQIKTFILQIVHLIYQWWQPPKLLVPLSNIKMLLPLRLLGTLHFFLKARTINFWRLFRPFPRHKILSNLGKIRKSSNLLHSSDLHHSFTRANLYSDLCHYLPCLAKKCSPTFNSCRLTLAYMVLTTC